MPKCMICGNEYKSLQRHIKCKHNMTSSEYKNKFPGCKLVSDDQINSLIDRNKSDKMKQAIINRNKSDKMRKIISDRNRDPEFIKKCKEGMNNPEVKAEQSRRLSERNRENWKDPEYKEKHQEISRQTQNRLNKDPKVIRRKSEMFKSLWRDPDISSRMLNSHKVSPFGRAIRYKDYYCRSQGEYEMILLLEELGASNITMETLRIPYSDNRTYIPDILCTINNITYVIEVKYDDNFYDHIEKVKGAISYCNNLGYKYCWCRRFVELPQIRKDKTLECSIITKDQLKEI